eukprot:363517-Chlamydomonas_euryale.AAC.5
MHTCSLLYAVPETSGLTTVLLQLQQLQPLVRVTVRVTGSGPRWVCRCETNWLDVILLTP